MANDNPRPVDAAFKHFGRSAAYTTPDGVPVPCTIIPHPLDAGRARKIALLAEVRVSEVARPEVGGFISYKGLSYPILAPVLRDAERDTWPLACGKPVSP